MAYGSVKFPQSFKKKKRDKFSCENLPTTNSIPNLRKKSKKQETEVDRQIDRQTDRQTEALRKKERSRANKQAKQKL